MADHKQPDGTPSDPAGTLEQIGRYCAYQERCTDDVEKKLKEWKVPVTKIPGILHLLKKEGFLDDTRFARGFVSGKLKINHWGRIRIRYELRCRKIPEKIIESALNEISQDAYHDIINMLIIKKRKEITKLKTGDARQKILKFVVGKGFEYEAVLNALATMEVKED